ncbi:MAG: response regulator [Lachnospiraceae bacterium]|nr:response regulator [Lachnospiraceae bacterium]
MYRVIVVDDEPAALAHLSSIIKKRCSGYQVIDTAENGREALEKVRQKKPDLLICDVKMPIMNGIELVQAVRSDSPDTYSVIVSGYQDFEYARDALKSGVCDYILKPVMPHSMKKTLDEIAVRLRADHYQKRNDIVRKLCNGMKVEAQEICRYFPYEKYYCAIIRKNGLPRRFSTDNHVEIYSDIYESMTIYGRDEMESLYLVPEQLLSEDFGTYIRQVEKKAECEDQYVTTVYDRASLPVMELQNKVKQFYRQLDAVSTVGYTQMLELSSNKKPRGIVFNHDEINHVLKNLENMVKEGAYDKLKKELAWFYKLWEQERKPQLWLEYMSRQIIYVVRKHSTTTLPLIEYEYMLEDAFYYAPTFQTLKENIFDIIFNYAVDTKQQAKVDSPEFFESVGLYLRSHLDENITLQSLCRRFSVSQTYLSKLFRKYTEDSFNHFFTKLRMEKAMELMCENKEFFIKDIALMVGYSDQFYFSRIFRSYTGKCPTDYIEEL